LDVVNKEKFLLRLAGVEPE